MTNLARFASCILFSEVSIKTAPLFIRASELKKTVCLKDSKAEPNKQFWSLKAEFMGIQHVV